MQKKKVLVGMSGGVDSSVTAYLLQKKGFEVHGLSIKMFSGNQNTDTREISNKIHIPLHTIDAQKDFHNDVIQYFINTYKEGKTPNPCVICNRYVKFQSLIDKAKQLEFEYVSTGHYANVKYDRKKNRYILKKAKDKKKDQTYALYNLTQKQLSMCIFPLGKYKKEEIRKIAKEINLQIEDEDESQDICFVPNGRYGEFISENSNIKDIPGDIVNKDGKVLGRHEGITRYTIGQRKGIKISSKEPFYVENIDIENNRIVVGKESDIYSRELIATDINLIAIDKLDKDLNVKAKIRYGAKEEKAIISPLNNGDIKVIFKEKQRAITPGQAVVFYRKDTVIGGGIIKEKYFGKERNK